MVSVSRWQKTLGGIALGLGIFVLVVSVWLLTVALKDERCKYFDPDDYTNRGTRYFNRDRSFRKWSGFGIGRSQDMDVWTNLEDYCINAVDNWKIASSLGLGFSIFQIILSAGLLIVTYIHNYGAAYIWTIAWCIGQLILIGGLVSALFIGIHGEVHQFHYPIKRVGPLFCAVTGIGTIVSVILLVLACFYVTRRSELDQAQAPHHERTNFHKQVIPQKD